MAEALPGPAGTWQHLCRWQGSVLDLRASSEAMPANDTHAAMAMMDEFPGWFHHCPGGGHDGGTWYIWDSRCHRPDSSDAAARAVHDFALRYERAVAVCREANRAQAVLAAGTGATSQAIRQAEKAAWEPFAAAEKYAAGLLRRTGSAALRMVLAEHAGTDEAKMAERHPYLLNFSNGTLDLATLQLRPHDPGDMITYCLDVPYDPAAACPLYWRLLFRACGERGDVTSFLARVLGYSLIGRNPRQIACFLNGPTASGKSALLTVLTRALGPLGHESQPPLVCLVRHGRNARTENSVRGARLVTITETSTYMTIDEAQLKRLTGEDWLNIDQHYAKKELGTPVTWLIIIATNQMPSLVNFDDAMRRRVIVIPMGETIPEHERDENLVSKIVSSEKPGVLSWLAREAHAYLQDGLSIPPAVQAETARYAAEQNTVGQFASDMCQPGGPEDAIDRLAAWNRYAEWADGQGKLGRNEFYAQFARIPGVALSEATRRFEGIRWKTAGPLG